MPGSYVAQPSNPSRNGYTFAGWYAEPGLSTPYIFSSIPNDSITVYADWETNSMIFSVVSGTDLMVNGNALYNSPTEIWVPKYHQGARVTAIDTFGFYGLRSVTRIKLPDSINQIGNQAFAGDLALTSIDVFGQGTHFNSLNGILYSADLTTLVNYPIGKTETSFTIPEGVITLGESAFDSALNLTSVAFPSTLKTVSEKAFIYCQHLVSVIMNEGLETIGANAFYWNALVEVNLPSTLLSLAVSAFDSTLTITSYSVAEGNLNFSSFEGHLYNQDKTTLRRYAVGKLNTEFTVPNGVTEIGQGAFREASHLTTVILPEGLISIQQEAFRSCYDLTQIELPVSLYRIGSFAFQYCNTLPGIYIPEGVGIMGHWVFDGCTAIHIYVQAFNPGSGWDVDWNASKPVTWAYGG